MKETSEMSPNYSDGVITDLLTFFRTLPPINLSARTIFQVWLRAHEENCLQVDTLNVPVEFKELVADHNQRMWQRKRLDEWKLPLHPLRLQEELLMLIKRVDELGHQLHEFKEDISRRVRSLEQKYEECKE